MVKHKDWIYLSRLAAECTDPVERAHLLDELDRLEFEDRMYHCQQARGHTHDN